MWRFILQENIRRYRELLHNESEPGERAVLESLLAAATAELDDLEDASTPEMARHDAALKLAAEEAVDGAMHLLNAGLGHLQVYDAKLNSLILLAQRNFRAPYLRHFAKVPIGDESVYARCFRQGRQAYAGNVAQETDQFYADVARQAGFAAVLSSAVRYRAGTPIGVLSVHFASTHNFAESELLLAARHADRVGVALGVLLEGKAG